MHPAKLGLGAWQSRYRKSTICLDKVLIISQAGWRNGSALLSGGKGCEFESRSSRDVILFLMLEFAIFWWGRGLTTFRTTRHRVFKWAITFVDFKVRHGLMIRRQLYLEHHQYNIQLTNEINSVPDSSTSIEYTKYRAALHTHPENSSQRSQF